MSAIRFNHLDGLKQHKSYYLYTLFGGYGFLQHGGLLIAFQAKAIFALLLQETEHKIYDATQGGNG